MHRINTSTASSGKFIDGNANQGIKGTQVDSSWLNSVQEELSNIVESSGETLDPTNDKQVLNALKVIIADYMKTTSASFANGESTAATSTAYAARIGTSGYKDMQWYSNILDYIVEKRNKGLCYFDSPDSCTKYYFEL